jgi:hypothetical protein
MAGRRRLLHDARTFARRFRGLTRILTAQARCFISYPAIGVETYLFVTTVQMPVAGSYSSLLERLGRAILGKTRRAASRG